MDKWTKKIKYWPYNLHFKREDQQVLSNAICHNNMFPVKNQFLEWKGVLNENLGKLTNAVGVAKANLQSSLSHLHFTFSKSIGHLEKLAHNSHSFRLSIEIWLANVAQSCMPALSNYVWLDCHLWLI